jgi:hypothetical protein
MLQKYKEMFCGGIFGLWDWHLHGLPADLSVRGLALVFADLQQSLVGDRFYVAVAQNVRCESGSPHSLCCRSVFLDLSTDRPVVYSVLSTDDAIAGCNAASIKLKILGSTEYDDLRGEPTVLLGIRPKRKSA